MNIDILSKVTGFQVDSRNILPGNVFFAMPGNKTNGTRFLKQVADNKGLAAFVPDWYGGGTYGLQLFYVQDVLSALQDLARKSLNGERVIGVTGSLGKTTTKEFIYQLLVGDCEVGKSIGNQNSQIGLALSILNRDRDKKVLVLEYGIDQIGGMDRLLSLCKPDIGVLTKIAPVHLQGLKSLLQIQKEKEKLLQAAKVKIGPKSLKKGKVFYSFGEKGDLWIEKKGKVFFYCYQEKKIPIYPPFKEEHFLQNLQAAILVAKYLGIQDEKIVKKIRQLKTVELRYEKIEKKGVTLIKDMYNASVESNKMALKSLPLPKRKGRRIGILGTMAEMGDKSNQLHYEVGKFAVEYVDYLFVLGKEAIEIKKGYETKKTSCQHFTDKKLLCQCVKNLIQKDDVVLIKGSRFLQMETLIPDIFDD